MKSKLSRFATDYGMFFVLLALCAFFSVVTIAEQHPAGVEAARRLAEDLKNEFGDSAQVVTVASKSPEDVAFTEALTERLEKAGNTVIGTVNGGPPEVRAALNQIVKNGGQPDVLACTQSPAKWSLISQLPEKFPQLANTRVRIPRSYLFPNFLKPSNLANVTGQSAVFAIIAIGMTMVIITAGIDLSVGSLVALSAVTAALLIRDVFSGPETGMFGMTVGCLGAIAVCGVVGLMTGCFVTFFGISPFIVTLATMSVARGLAQIFAEGQSVYQIPEGFSWFATGHMLGVRNEVFAMIVLYVVAHVVMSQTTLGRYIYAVGGNRESARLSGVPVMAVLLFVYTMCGALAGVGGVIEASRLRSGSPLYGNMYELYVITAVVVGGTSLAGGEGKVLGTLIGALIIAVIRNGMNLMNIESYTQGVVMGFLILAAVLIDACKKKGWGGRIADSVERIFRSE